jgi:Cep192 domain 4
VLVQDSVSPMALTFGSTSLLTSSAAQTVTVTNTDTAQTLIISSGPVVTGDYSVSSNTCTSLLAPGQSCTIGVTFTPTSPGSRLGTLIINGPNGNSFPATVQLSGTGNGAGTTGVSGTTTSTSGFSLTGPATWAVTKGTAASIPVVLTSPAGYSGNVMLSCAPTNICSLSATGSSSANGTNYSINVPVSGATSIPVTVTVTMPAGNTVLIGNLMRPGRLLATLLPFGGIGLALAGRRKRWLLALGLILCLALGMLGCGGGATSSNGGSSTPQVTITATPQPGTAPPPLVVALSVS